MRELMQRTMESIVREEVEGSIEGSGGSESAAGLLHLVAHAMDEVYKNVCVCMP